MLLDGLEPVNFKEGEVIFKEGDPPGGVYLIDKGTVEITKLHAGEKYVLTRRNFNEIFGEMSLVDDKPRSATATATEDTWCYILSADAFRDNLNNIHPFVLSVFQTMSGTIRQMTETQSLIANMLNIKGESS